MRGKLLAALLAAAALALLALAPLAAPQPARAASAEYTLSLMNLTPVYLLPGTPGSSVPPVVYIGTIIYGGGWTSCSASAAPSSASYGGLAPQVSATCSASSPGVASVTVYVTFSGTYVGGNYTAYPFNYVTVTFYYPNGSRASVVANPNSPVSVREDSISGLMVVSATITGYSAIPPNASLGETVLFVPVGTAELNVLVSQPVSGAAELNVSYGTGWASAYLPPGGTLAAAEAKNFPLVPQAAVAVYNYGYEVYAGQVSVGNYGGAAVAVYFPILNYYPGSKGGYTAVTGQVDVANLSAGTLTVVMNASGVIGSVTISSPGLYYEPVVNVSGQPAELIGYYQITYTNAGHSVTVKIPFSQSLSLNIGNIVYIVFLATFVAMLVGGALAIVAGLLMRNLALTYGGLVFFIGAVLLFVVPTLIGDVIYLLNVAGFNDPALVGTALTVQNLGAAVDASIEYVYRSAMSLSSVMLALASAATIVAGALAVFAGGVAGDLAMLALTAWLLYGALKALAVLFPIFIIVTLVIMLIIGALQILVGALTGNIAPALETIVNLASVILLVLLAPVILATLNKIAVASEIHILGHPLPSPAYVVIALIEALLLVLIMVYAFQRMLSALGGAVGLAASI